MMTKNFMRQSLFFCQKRQYDTMKSAAADLFFCSPIKLCAQVYDIMINLYVEIFAELG